MVLHVTSLSHYLIKFTPFYRQADWGSEKYSNLSKVTQLESGRIRRQALGCLTQSPVLNPARERNMRAVLHQGKPHFTDSASDPTDIFHDEYITACYNSLCSGRERDPM